MMGVAGRYLRSGLSAVIDFALPPRCPGCGVVTGAQDAFCFDCWSNLDLLGPPCCARCALPFEHGGAGEDALCAGCMAQPPAFDRLRAAVAYGDLASSVALKLKYGRKPGVAGTMAGLMARHVDAAARPILCPVPLHRWRIWRRGYNQSALIAAALGRRFKLEVRQDLLLRVRPTPPLRGMSPHQRRQTVQGAFALKESRRAAIKGRNILVIDDVFTSGATAGACARVLKRGGAAEVAILCWARVIRDEH